MQIDNTTSRRDFLKAFLAAGIFTPGYLISRNLTSRPIRTNNGTIQSKDKLPAAQQTSEESTTVQVAKVAPALASVGAATYVLLTTDFAKEQMEP